MLISNGIKYLTSRFESVDVVSNSLCLLQKIKAIFRSRLEPERNRFESSMYEYFKKQKYYFQVDLNLDQISLMSILLKILCCLESKRFYKAIQLF